MATIDSKYVDVGVYSLYTTNIYGYGEILAFGNISDTANGAKSQGWAGLSNAPILYCQYTVDSSTTPSTYTLLFGVETTSTVNYKTSIFDTMSIGGVEYRTDAANCSFTASDGTASGVAYWSWTTTSANPFGIVAGVDKLVTWETDATVSYVAPVINTVTSDNAAAANVTATVNLTSNGSGGSLQFAQTTTNSVPATGWQASATFSHPRGTTRYYWASQATNTAGAYSTSSSLAVGYIAPDSSITTIANYSILNSATSHSITIANGGSTTVYEVRITSYTGTIVGSRTGNGTLTISNVPPDNGTTRYYITCYLATTSGGDGLRDSIQTFDVTATAGDVAPVIGSVTSNNAAATSVTATVNLTSSGSGGVSLKYAQTTTNVLPTTGWQTSNQFSQDRNTTRYYWASRNEATSLYTTSTSLAVGYIAPDIAVTPSSTPALGVSATSASTTVTGVTVGEEYAVRVNNGTTNLASGTATTTSITLTFSSSLPAAGATSTYEIFSRRPTAIGGDNAWDPTDDIFTVTRSTDNIPNSFTFTDNNSFSPPGGVATSNTITVGGMTAGVSVTVTVSGNGQYSKNGGTYTSAAGTAANGDTFTVRHTTTNDYSASNSTTLTIGGVSDTFNTTTAAFSGNTLTVYVSGEYELQNDVFVNWSGAGGTSNNVLTATKLAPGDRVGFLWGGLTSANEVPVTVSGFASTHWTDVSGITIAVNQSTPIYKYASATIPTTTTDGVTATATSPQNFSSSVTRYFVGQAVNPDTTITVTNPSILIATGDTDFDVSFTDSGDSTNSTITYYRVLDENNVAHESRLGPGTITVTDIPPNPGFPKTYEIQARVLSENGGNNVWVACPDSAFTVIASSAASTADPTIDAYGLAIYDEAGTAITSFTSGHTVLRKIFTASTTTLTTGYREVDTGLTGISESNCIISLEGESVTGAALSVRMPATFITGGNGNTWVRLGKTNSSRTIKITVSQFSGQTIGAAASGYGLLIKNGDGDIVIDENSTTFAVREIIQINTSLSTQALYQGPEAYYVVVELTQGRYPSSAGLPLPAVGCTQSSLLIPPSLYTTTWSDGSYRYVQVTIPKNASTTTYSIAMLVSSDTTTPEYYGGTASNYGLQINNSSGVLKWRSDWRQAIVNNVIPANQFTVGTYQNGEYDVTIGYDGVESPTSANSGFAEREIALYSRGQYRVISNLNEMDPLNTYLLGNCVTGNVEYYSGDLYIDNTPLGTAGGGRHIPAITVTGFTSAAITMWRSGAGIDAPPGVANLSRDPDSYHPEGAFVLARIV